MKNFLYILFILSITLSCFSTPGYQIYQKDNRINSDQIHSLNLDFKEFKDLPLLVDIYINNVKEIQGEEIKCMDSGKEFHLKFNNEKININLENKMYCLTISVHYNTFRPYQKNLKSSLLLDLNSNGECLRKSKINALFTHYKCKYLDFTNNSHSIIFTNIPSERTDKQLAIISWGTTFTSAFKPPPFIYFTPIPLFLFGYITVENQISFEID